MRSAAKMFAVVYIFGYWYYWIIMMIAAWPKLGLMSYSTYAVTQAIVAVLWPLWLALGSRPLAM